MKYLVVLDIGTSSVRAILFDENLKSVGVSQKEIKLASPQPGWVEQDPLELLKATKEVLKDVLGRAKPGEVAGVALANQRETTIVWSKITGKPVYPAIVWQDRRTAEVCEKLKRGGWEKKISQLTGLRFDPYFSATKLQWILNNVAEAKKNSKDLLFGTVDTWLLWNLTGKHITDASNASRTMLWNIKSREWDKNLLAKFHIPASMLPIVSDTAPVGILVALKKELFGAALPILAICGDQQAALFGLGSVNKGEAVSIYGTGGFVLINAGSGASQPVKGLLTTVAWSLNQEMTYAYEGSIFQSGGIFKWLRDNLGVISDYQEVEELKETEKKIDEVYLVPAFVGLGAPYWRPSAKGAITGLTNQTSRRDIIKAGLEAAAFQVADVLSALPNKVKIKTLKMAGGLTRSRYLAQFQADILGIPVLVSSVTEATALGVAHLGAQKLGWGNIPSAGGEIFRPRMNPVERKKLLAGWRNALKKIINT